MRYVGQILLLAASVVFTLTFCAAVFGARQGRLKSEPSAPWVTFRDRPVRFVAMVLFNIVAACVFAVASFKAAGELLGFEAR